MERRTEHSEETRPLVEMQHMLARMSDDERRFRLSEMLDMLYAMPGERAAKLMREVAAARAQLDPEERQLLMGSQKQVLGSYAERKRTFLRSVEEEVMKSMPEPAA